MNRHFAALALFLLAAALLPARARAQKQTQPQDATTAGRILRRSAHARLARLRMAHLGRRQSQRPRRRHLPQTRRSAMAQGAAAPAPPARASPRRLAARRLRPLFQLRRAQHVRRQHPQSRARHRIRMPLRAHRSRWRQRQSRKASSPSARARSRCLPKAATSITSIPSATRAPSRSRPSPACMAAYYMGSDQSDHSNAFPPRVQPGDIILVHAGLYKDNRFVYSGFDRTIAALRHSVRRHLLPHRQRHARKADRHQRRGRWRSDLRRRRLPEPLQPDGRELQLFRRHHRAQHQRRVPARASRISPAPAASR